MPFLGGSFLEGITGKEWKCLEVVACLIMCLGVSTNKSFYTIISQVIYSSPHTSMKNTEMQTLSLCMETEKSHVVT